MKKKVIFCVFILIILPLLSSEKSETKNPRELEAQLKMSSGQERIDILNRLAFLSFYKEPGKSIEYSREAVNLSDRFHNLPGKAAALFHLAGAHWNLDHTKDAFKYILESLRLFKILKDNNNLKRAAERAGYYYLKIGNHPEALKYGIRSFELSVELGDENKIAEAHFQLGRIYIHVNKERDALEHFQAALKIAEKTGHKHRWLYLNNIGVAHKSMKQYTRAIKYYQKTLELARRENRMDRVSGAMLNIGIVYGELKQHDKALSYLLRALKKNEETGNKPDSRKILLSIGDQYYKKQNYESSESYYFKALAIIEKSGSTIDKELIYERLSRLYAKMEDDKTALRYYKMYSIIKDSRVNERKNKQYLELQERYEADRREKEIEILKRNNKIQQMTRNFLFAGLLVVLIILFFFFKRYMHLFSFWKKEKYIGQYRIIEPIGEGGMGNVFKAYHIKNKTSIVAIKVLKDILFRVESSRKRFKNEGVIIDQLNHPNIVKVYERGQSDNRMYIVMEYVHGETLEKMIACEGKINLTVCIHIMIQVSDALAKIHSKNIVHRDLKPANILLTEQNGDTYFVKLLDFGLSKMKSQSRYTQSGVIVGTVNYVSPEQVIDLEYSSASDIYSLGVIFYEMLVGETAFPGDSMPTIVDRILNRKLEPISKMRPELPGDLSRLITKMIAKNPAQRPGAELVLRKLEKISGLID